MSKYPKSPLSPPDHPEHLGLHLCQERVSLATGRADLQRLDTRHLHRHFHSQSAQGISSEAQGVYHQCQDEVPVLSGKDEGVMCSRQAGRQAWHKRSLKS